ncbi:MAG: alpha/beta hydrolase, partial [Alphaproteobacteria bacterium]|nr:alpha/beta hydrolase [Alphaproteobacteria bacterium]
DWLQSIHTEAPQCWIAGFSFGAWIGMQLLMRRPEISGFISISPPANRYDFSFLAPCPASGLIVHGDKDEIVPPASIEEMIAKVAKQRDVIIERKLIEGADHFYGTQLDELDQSVVAYLDRRMKEIDAERAKAEED